MICADSRPDAAPSTAVGIGSPASALELDLTDGAAVAAARRDLGPPDILVDVAVRHVRKRILDYTDDDLDQVVYLNIKGTFRLCPRLLASWPRGFLCSVSMAARHSSWERGAASAPLSPRDWPRSVRR